MADSSKSCPPATPKALQKTKPSKAKWTKIFLTQLAVSSNVSAAAKAAGVSTFVVYETRRGDAEFNRAWRMALCEGYDALEMALLQRLREGEIKPAANAKKGVRSYDNANALRLLAAHRDTVAKERAVREEEDADAVLASLNAKLDRMRERWLASKEDGDDEA
jgi:hypothetical protein